VTRDDRRGVEAKDDGRGKLEVELQSHASIVPVSEANVFGPARNARKRSFRVPHLS
jgi:hypothetical protein